MFSLVWIHLLCSFLGGHVLAGEITTKPPAETEALKGENFQISFIYELDDGERDPFYYSLEYIEKDGVAKNMFISGDVIPLDSFSNFQVIVDSVNPYNLTLLLTSAMLDNEGQYKFAIATRDGSGRTLVAITQLTVNVPAHSISASPSDVQTQPGGSFSLTCTASGKPTPLITWSRQDDRLPSGEFSVARETLDASNVSKTDGGVYICTASNGFGVAVQAEVLVEVSYPPEVSATTTVVYSGPGQKSLKLNCIFDAYPPVDVDWLVNGVNVSDQSRVFQSKVKSDLEKNVETSTLEIEMVRSTDVEKDYVCDGENVVGDARAVIRVRGVPMPVTIISSKLSDYGDQYELIWNVTSYSPVLEYNVSFEDISAENKSYSSFMMNVPGDGMSEGPSYQTRKMLTGLNPEKMYEVVIQARNEFGFGDENERFTFTTNKRGATPPPPTTMPTTTVATTEMPEVEKTEGMPEETSTVAMVSPTADDVAHVNATEDVTEMDDDDDDDDDEDDEDDETEKDGELDKEETDTKTEKTKAGELGPKDAGSLIHASYAVMMSALLLSLLL